MIDRAGAERDLDPFYDDISPAAAAAYIFDLSQELGQLACQVRLTQLAAVLHRASALAAEAMAVDQPEKATSDDAA
jgi:hypothetical protein